MRVDQPIRDWLNAFAACVRNRDLDSGKLLFSEDASGFGTRVRQAHNLAELIEQQWSPTWLSTREFRFAPESVSTLFSADESQVVVTALWDSLGIKPTGATFPRQGRCTLILRQENSSPHGYVAIHSHFSKDPAGDF